MIVERIKLAVAALLLIGGAGRPSLSIFDISDEEAAVLAGDGWRVSRFTKKGRTWFSLVRELDGLSVWAFTVTRPAASWELEASGVEVEPATQERALDEVAS